MLVPRTTCQTAARNRARADTSATPAEASERVVTTNYRSRDTPGTCCNDHFVDGCLPSVTAMGRVLGSPISGVMLRLGHLARVPPMNRPSSSPLPSAELTGPASGAGRAREGLGDTDPFSRDRARDRQADVGRMPSLGDDQAEVQRRAAYDVGRALRAGGPRRAVRQGEFYPYGRLRHRAAAHGVAPGPRPYADIGDVPQPRGRFPDRSQP